MKLLCHPMQVQGHLRGLCPCFGRRGEEITFDVVILDLRRHCVAVVWAIYGVM